jgi:hypothetical protein
MNDGHAADDLGQALLELFLVVAGGGLFDLGADLLDPGLDLLGVAGAVDDGGVFLVDDDALGLATRSTSSCFKSSCRRFGKTDTVRMAISSAWPCGVAEDRGIEAQTCWCRAAC